MRRRGKARGLSRRRFGALAGAGLLGACIGGTKPTGVGRGAAPAQTGAPLQKTAQGDAAELNAALEAHRARMDLAATGLVVLRQGQTVHAGAAGWAGGLSDAEKAAGLAQRRFTVDTPFRVASMSKSAVALTAVSLARRGVVDLDADVSPHLGFALRHPEAPGVPVTLAMLLSHTSGIRDPETYWIAAPGTISSLVSPAVHGPLAGQAPGQWFEYANLNSGLAASVLEAASGERFDRLVRAHVLAPAGLDAGFNWSGVSLARRQDGATLYRRGANGAWETQTDGAEVLAGTGPPLLAEPGFHLEDYVPGTNGTLFSPQGGLRASLSDLVGLARRYAQTPEMLSLCWQRNAAGDNGLHDNGFFAASGPGMLHYPAAVSPFGTIPTWGHYGEAYGLYGAYWILPDADVIIAYAALGVPERTFARGRHPGLNAYTEPLADLAARLAGLA